MPTSYQKKKKPVGYTDVKIAGRTPEESKANLKAAQEFVSQREKLVSQRLQGAPTTAGEVERLRGEVTPIIEEQRAAKERMQKIKELQAQKEVGITEFYKPTQEEIQAEEKKKLPPVKKTLVSGIAEKLGYTPEVQANLKQAREEGGILGEMKAMAGEVLTVAVPPAFQIIDTLRTGITGKEPLKVQRAEEELNRALKQLDDDLDLLKQGLKSPSNVRLDFVRAQAALNHLEASQKGVGKINVRYWSDQGAAIEQEILNTKSRFETYPAEVENAIIERYKII